jgi:cysteinyl-tRNA synthetase
LRARAAQADSAAQSALLRGAALLGLLQATPAEWFQGKAGTVDRDAVEARIRDRLAFIGQKNWAEADRIRDELLAEGVQLKDSKDPKTGERRTEWEVRR